MRDIASAEAFEKPGPSTANPQLATATIGKVRNSSLRASLSRFEPIGIAHAQAIFMRSESWPICSIAGDTESASYRLNLITSRDNFPRFQ